MIKVLLQELNSLLIIHLYEIRKGKSKMGMVSSSLIEKLVNNPSV